MCLCACMVLGGRVRRGVEAWWQSRVQPCQHQRSAGRRGRQTGGLAGRQVWANLVQQPQRGEPGPVPHAEEERRFVQHQQLHILWAEGAGRRAAAKQRGTGWDRQGPAPATASPAAAACCPGGEEARRGRSSPRTAATTT